MPLSKLQCYTFVGVKAVKVHIEVHLSAGLPSFAIVGLPDTEIRESKERVRSALLNSGFEFPTQRITVNLAPADLPKGTASFDLAIALGIAQASGQLPNAQLDHWIFAGELSLSGQLTHTRCPLALAVAVRKETQRNQQPLRLMMPLADAPLAACVPDVAVYGAPNLLEAAAHLVGHGPGLSRTLLESQLHTSQVVHPTPPDLADVVGHEAAKHALLVATAGHHHLRLVGPPGSGKSMLAQRMAHLLPPMGFEEALDHAAVLDLKGEWNLTAAQAVTQARPFRNPHPSTSLVALVGGGNPPAPGEITLAHQGLLFTDEVLEFDRRTLEALREPLETGRVNISRAGHQASFPARFLWVCAHNPCPCGWLGHAVNPCRCTPEQVRRYQGKLSGPLADRLDISVEVHPVEAARLMQSQTEAAPALRTADYQAKVAQARALQLQRQGCLNGELSPGLVQKLCKPQADAEKLLLSYAHKHHLSSRAVHRICRVARTLADLEQEPHISRPHIATAIQYRKSLNALHGLSTTAPKLDLSPKPALNPAASDEGQLA